MSLLPRPAVATDALVLRAWSVGETSTIASLLTARCGYLRVIAKGARTSSSLLGPLVQPGRLVSIECGLDPGRELQYLRGGAVLLDPLAAAGNSLERTVFLLAALELVDRCRPAGEHEERLFGLCREFVRMLSCGAPDGAAALFYALELELLDLHGLSPVLDGCAACGRSRSRGLEAGSCFSPAAGGLVCASCADSGRGRDGRALGSAAVTRLRSLAAGLAPAVGLAADPWADRETGILLHRFLDFHLPGYRLPAALDLLRAGRKPGAATDAGADARMGGASNRGGGEV